MSETLRDLVVRLSLNSDNFTRNIKSINKQIQEAQSTFQMAAAGVENFENTTVGLASKLNMLDRTLSLQQDALLQYDKAQRCGYADHRRQHRHLWLRPSGVQAVRPG